MQSLRKLPDYLLKNVNFEAGLASWYLNRAPEYLNHGPEYLNLRRTFRHTPFAASRLLGNLGVSGSMPLLERFGEPVGAAKWPSVVRNGDFSADANGNGLAVEWEFTATPKAPPAPGRYRPGRKVAGPISSGCRPWWPGPRCRRS